MDENKVGGSIEEIKGAAKVGIGQAFGDAKLQSDGDGDKVVGKFGMVLAACATRCATRKP